jgi:glutamate-1-semialdehyde 2,1-aminomutase
VKEYSTAMAQRTVAIIQARMTSSRLPGKMLTDLGGHPLVAWVARAARAIPGVSEVVLATSDDPSDAPLSAWCEEHGLACVRGPLHDVLSRVVLAADVSNADNILRLTGDCPFLDPWAAGLVVAALRETGADYATNADGGTWPDGLDAEAVTRDALRAADENAVGPVEREHVLPHLRRNQARYKTQSVPCPIPGIGGHRWTVDTKDDLAFLRGIAAHLAADRPPSMIEILEILRAHPELARADEPSRNEGYRGLLRGSNDPPPSFDRSNTLYRDVVRTVPTASQTFSKSALQVPVPHAPLFLTHGLGGRVWDVDGNEYVDMMCGLLSVSIGYRDPRVDEAIRHQLNRGISFSLPSLLESELAEKIVDAVPAAEMVRFGKNGTDATSAAVRVSRAYTGRDRIIVCGYHGWQDWYIGSTARHKGVPGAVSSLTSPVPYNDLDAVRAVFDAHPGEIAAIVMEAATFDPPKPGYLEGVKALAHERGAVLVFDEIVTGFRFALGGAQEMLGVTPDLACIGKGLGNGMPISAVVGRADLMREMEDIFFSGTFGGEALSLAAGIAVIDMMRDEPVIERFWELGDRLGADIRTAIKRNGLTHCFDLKGWAPWTLTAIADADGARKEAIRTLFLREMMARGVLTLGSHNICYRHSDADIRHTAEVYDEVLGLVAAELATGSLEQRLGHPAIEPIFQVRPAKR